MFDTMYIIWESGAEEKCRILYTIVEGVILIKKLNIHSFKYIIGFYFWKQQCGMGRAQMVTTVDYTY